MSSIVVLDACTIVNLARIDDGGFLENKVKTLKTYVVEKVLDEVRLHYAPSCNTDIKFLYQVPYWGDLTRCDNADVEDHVSIVKTFLNYQKKPNGELYSTALSLYLSRMEEEKVFFYTDDYPAIRDFKPFFEFQQVGYIGDSVDLLVFLYWLSPKGQFSKEELKLYLTALRSEYASNLNNLRKKIDQYALKSCGSKRKIERKYKMEGLSSELMSGQSLINTIEKCRRFFEEDHTTLGKEINKILENFSSFPSIVEKIGKTIEYMDKFGIYKI